MPRSPRTSTTPAIARASSSSGNHQRHRRERKRESKPVMPSGSVPRIGDGGEGVSMDRRVGMSQERDRKRHNFRLTSSTDSGRGPADPPATRHHVFSASTTAALGSVIDLDDTPAPTPAPSRASVHGPSSLSLNRAQRQSGSLLVYPTPRYDIDFNSLVGHYISAPPTSEPRISQDTSTTGPGPSTPVGPDPFERIKQLESELSSMTSLRDQLRDENECLHGWRKASGEQLKEARSQVDHLIEQTWGRGLESEMTLGAELFGPVISDAIVGSLRTGSGRGDGLKVETPFQSGDSGDPIGVDDGGYVAEESVSADNPMAIRPPGQDTRTIRQLQLELQRQSSRYDKLKAQQTSERRELEDCLWATKQTHAKELKAKDEEIRSLEKRLQDREAAHSKLMSDMVERRTREYTLYSDRMGKQCSKLGIEAKYFKAMVEAMCGRVDRLEKQLALLKRSTNQPPIQEPSSSQSKPSSLAEPPSAILESLAEVVAREGAILTRDGFVISQEVNCDASGDGMPGGLDQGTINWGGVKDYSRSHWQDTAKAETKQRAIDLMRHWDKKKQYWASEGSNGQLLSTSGRAELGDQDEEEMLMNREAI